MNGQQQPTIQILLEQGLQPRTRKSESDPAARRSSDFMAFSYTRKGRDAGCFKELRGTQDSVSAGCTVSVFGFTKTAQLGRARKLVKQHSRPHQAMIAIASPAVFNDPEFRSVFTGDHVEVLMEDRNNFHVSHLVPWISKLLKALAKDPPAPASKPAFDSLDISTRLRDPASGRLNAAHFVDLLGISSSDLATKVCGVSKQAISQNPTSAGIQDKLQPLEEIALLLHWCGGDAAKLRAWLMRPNRDFPAISGKTPSPMDLILLGHAPIVAQKAHNLLTGHPA